MLCVLQLVLLVADWCVTGDGFLLGDMGRLNFRVQQGVEALLGRGATDDTNNTLAPMEDAKLTAPQLIVKYGYYVEIHHVVTEDGFILELHRVPGSPRNPPAQGKSVFLLEHGLLCSSADWLIQGPGKSLALPHQEDYLEELYNKVSIAYTYLLADQGFDVWLGNARGNTYSRRHVRLSPDDPQFWNHDWHHMGVFDLPAEIDYILQNTRQQSLYYAGHSMGTTKFFVMASKRPEYNLKIRTMFALAPIVFMSHIQSPFKKLAFAGETLFDIANMLGMHEFSPSNTLMTILGQSMCKNMVINNMVCNMALFLMAGFNSIEMNQTLIPILMGHYPAGSSSNCFVHYIQEILSGKFREFDNRPQLLPTGLRLGNVEPLDYPLHMITAPVVLLYASNDWMSDIRDVSRLASSLPNVIDSYLIPQSTFNHLDFMYGIHSNTLVYDRIFSILNPNSRLRGAGPYSWGTYLTK